MGLNTDARRKAALFVAVSLVAGFGGNAMILTSGIWVMSLTGDAGLAALATASFYVPSLAGPMIGALADRMPRRALLVRTAPVVAGGLLILLAVRGPGQVGLIFAVMLGYGAALSLMDAAEAGLLPAALPGDALGTVNGLRMSAQEGVKLVAPLAGAALFTLAGAAPVIILSATLLSASAALYAALRLPRSGGAAASAGAAEAGGVAAFGGAARSGGAAASAGVAASGGGAASGGAASGGGGTSGGAASGGVAGSEGAANPGGSPACGGVAGSGVAADPGGAAASGDAAGSGGVWAAWAVGAGHLRREPGLGAIVLAATAAMAAAALGSGVLYAMIDDGLGRGPAFAGVLSSVQGGGAILGGLLTGRLLASRGGRRPGGTPPSGETLLAACGAVLVGVALLLRSVPWSPAVIAGSLTLGLGLPWAVVAASTAVQRGTPGPQLGRVSATATSLIFATPAIVTPAAAGLLPATGYRPILLAAAVLALGAGVLSFTRATPFRPRG